MGGDLGPRVTVEASLAALNRHPNLTILLVGDASVLNSFIASHSNERLKVVHAPDTIAPDVSVMWALREGSSSSMHRALEIVSQNQAKACISAGNTGALMALARRTLGTLPGINRPAITASLPSLNGECQLLDLGANIDSTAEMLTQFAILGRALVRIIKGREATIGLLNVGTEEGKGTHVLNQASGVIAQLPGVHYVGFVEGDDLYAGKADLVVCDGLPGNVALKSSEGLAQLMSLSVHQAFNRSFYRRCVAWLAKPILGELKEQLNASSRNGALFLGLKGVVVKSHGSVNAEGFGAAIDYTVTMLGLNLPDQMAEYVSDDLNSLSNGSDLS